MTNSSKVSGVRAAVDMLASLRLTVSLLLLSIVLVFAGTIDQVHLGIWAVQKKYFHSFFVWLTVPGTDFTLPVFPAGYLLGGLLLTNLVAAFLTRFRFSTKKAGIILVHAGLMLLLIGEALSGIFQRDAQMRIAVGQTSRYVESARDFELAITDITDPRTNRIVAIDASRLRSKKVIQTSALPFVVQSQGYFPNALVRMRAPAIDGPADPEITGAGATVVIQPVPEVSAENQSNWPATVVRLEGPGGRIGTLLISAMMTAPQEVAEGGRRWQIELRPRRDYLAYTLTLSKFVHDVYPGTDIPKSFASEILLRDGKTGGERRVSISMNNPLRYQGLAFYQAGFENNDRTSVLQVVSNPSWRIPYLSCALMGSGLVLQFGLSLRRFLKPRVKVSPATTGKSPVGKLQTVNS